MFTLILWEIINLQGIIKINNIKFSTGKCNFVFQTKSIEMYLLVRGFKLGYENKN